VADERRVFLHVGVPKTGTTFVQDVLWRSRTALARGGVCYPLGRRAEHFAAAMDLRGASWGGRHNPDWEGTWARLARTVRESEARTGVLSSELLAAADEDAVERAVASFPDRQVHVVLTVRDLARQLVSGWQEQVKHRVSVPLDAFVAGCLDDPDATDRARRLASRFWPLHDVADVALRWGARVPPERLHLVTVGPSGGPRDLLWRRFAAVTGVDPELGRVDTARPNSSLAAPEAELLRRYNTDHAADLTPQHYDQVVRALLAEKVLAGGGPPGAAGGPALMLPARFAEAAQTRARDMVRALSARGHDVVGDLAELVPDAAALRAGPPRPVDDTRLAAAGVRATAGLLVELGPLQRRLESRQKARRKARGDDRHEARQDAPPPDGGRPRRRGRAPGATSGLAGAADLPVEPGPVYLHVGAPKTGTTYLQDVLWHHREELAAAGLRFARRAYHDHYQASLDLRDVGDRDGPAPGTWDRVAADTRAWAGTSVISHELFASAQPEHVARALDGLGADRVHVVYTVRDLWRLLGAEWQEATKHGRALSFEAYLDDVLEQGRDGVVGRWFWSVHDPVDVLRRWGAQLPPERVHVVTVPRAGADPTLLWQRFAGLVGVDPSLVDTAIARPNTSLGAEEVTFLRLVNAGLGGRKGGQLGSVEYGRYVKRLLAEGVLAQRPGKTRYAPPPQRFEQARGWAEQFVAGLREAGYHVVGDLDELVPPGPGDATANPDATSDAALTAVGVDALAGLVRYAARMREQHGFGIDAQAPRTDAEHGSGAASAVGPRRAARLLRRAGAAVTRRGRSGRVDQ